MPPRIVLILGLALFMNIALPVLQVAMLRRRKPWPKFIGIAVVVWSTAMIFLFLLQILSPPGWISFLRRWLYFPMSVEMVWNLVLLIAFPLMILLALVLGRLRPVKKEIPLSPDAISRRNFLYLATYSTVPALTIGLGVHGTITRNDLRVRNLSIPIADLPPELEGFTIAHVSDLHSGIYVGPERLKIISDATNDLKADLVTVTGDVINRSMTEFAPAIAAIKAMESRHGTYLCEGNHDIIPGPGVVMNACAENNLPMLAYENVILPIRGRRLILGGVPWNKDGFKPGPALINQLFPERREGDVRVLLAHHPDFFDIADSADLVLTGHTHGGQIMLDDQIGLGPLLFKYWSGLYHRGNTSMVVSNGGGDWFPCRIKAPAEIALITLKKA